METCLCQPWSLHQSPEQVHSAPNLQSSLSLTNPLKLNRQLCACLPSRFNVSDSLCPYGPWPARFLHPWDSPGNNTGVGCHALLQGIFLTQVSCIAGRCFTNRATREAHEYDIQACKEYWEKVRQTSYLSKNEYFFSFCSHPLFQTHKEKMKGNVSTRTKECQPPSEGSISFPLYISHPVSQKKKKVCRIDQTTFIVGETPKGIRRYVIYNNTWLCE